MKNIAKVLLSMTTVAWVACAAAQEYPARPITIVTPAPPGGTVDVVARALADEMGKSLKATVIVDSKPGASGMLAVQTVARAAPDGYTLLVTHSAPLIYAPYLFTNVSYNAQRDLSLITQLCNGQLVLAINPQAVPARNMKEFIAWAGNNKGKVSYGSYGVGSAGHVMSAFLNQSGELDMVHSPYKGETPMLQDLAGGQIQWALASSGTIAPYAQSGRLRPLAIMGDRRLKDLPEVPTMAEAGFPQSEYKTVGWITLTGPAGIPAPVLSKIEAAARAAVQSAQMKSRFQVYGMDAMGTSSADFRRDFADTVPVVQRLVKASGAKME